MTVIEAVEPPMALAAATGQSPRARWHAVGKRVLDVTLALLALTLAAPMLVLAAVAIRFDTRGPALFVQERVGLRGRTFRIVKLRTMVVDAEAQLAELKRRHRSASPLFKMADDPRVTRVGRVLRALSIDELPQLWNVLRGEMSLVGPRPALPSEVPSWEGRLHDRVLVRPGITGLWQVSGRSSASFDDYVRYDLHYVDNWTLLVDLRILVRTIPAVVRRRGAC